MPPKKDGKTGKTNKTAHVLSLLTDPEEAKAEAAPGEEATAPVVTAPASPPVLEVVRANDDAVSGKIKDELAKALEMELADEAPAAQGVKAEPAPETQAVPTPEAPVQVQEAQAAPTPAAPVQEALPAVQQTQIPPTPPQTAVKGITCVNVMQALVEEKADKYIQRFGLCTCPRCRIDVIALALTNLPAKYVVMRELDAIPMLTVYEGRYNAAVISQVMWACKRVMDFPRH